MKKLLLLLFILASLESFGQTTSVSSVTKTTLSTKDTLVATTTKTTTITSLTVYDTVITASVKYDTLKYKAPVIVPAAISMPGGLVSRSVAYQNKSNFVISGLSFDGGGGTVDLITLTGCSNVTITLCRFSNTGARSIVLNNCHNITIDWNYFTMVGFGIDAIGCTGNIKTNFNQGLNLWQPAKYNNNFAHWVQYYKCSGPGQEINDNIFVSVDGIALHPHDCISSDLTSGTLISPVQICRNKIFGGQIAGGWPLPGDTGVGITAPDEGGSYYLIKDNLVVNSGVNGIICVTTSPASNIVVDNNIILNYDKNSKKSYDGFTISGAKSNMTVSNNRVRWMRPDGTYLGYWFGGSSAFPGVTFINNNWNDATLTSSILPSSLLTFK
jgi:hypothetical protein